MFTMFPNTYTRNINIVSAERRTEKLPGTGLPKASTGRRSIFSYAYHHCVVRSVNATRKKIRPALIKATVFVRSSYFILDFILIDHLRCYFLVIRHNPGIGFLLEFQSFI